MKWDKTATGAIRQIKDKNYPDVVKEYTGDILLVGISYDKKTKQHEYIIEKCKEQVEVVERGRFGADMKVSLINDGPFTIVLDSETL